MKNTYPIREIENSWIPLSDGTRLAARIWLPEDAEQTPVPAILEYLPYRKNDLMAIRDSIHHPWFASRGYACLRVDIRGSGDSDGILYNEYVKQEQDDGLEIIAWIAEQPWCNGSVGMMGISWGGFNSLQMAARRPPALKAVIALCATDDRYADDAHYIGGCVLASDMMLWGGIFFAHNCCPPDPQLFGDGWRETWLARMEKAAPPIEMWMGHQHRDAYWKHGSVCEDFGAIDIPVYAVGGWADGYSDSVFRTLAGLSGPAKGLIGPWAHSYPDSALPGPQINFLNEALRWWDHWLKGEPNQIMDEPKFRLWMQESVPPQTSYEHRPGRWVAEPSWPPPAAHTASQTYFLNERGLRSDPGADKAITIHSKQTHGLHAGRWCPFGAPGELPADQRHEDGLTQTFTSPPLADAVEILGFPTVTLTLSVDQPVALIALRLCDVAPNGASTLVTRGILNLTHRDSHEHPTALEPGKEYSVTIQLNAIAHAMPAGHRWRLAVATTHWPMAWPSPKPVALTLHCGEGCQLTLPIRPLQATDETLPAFEPITEAVGPTIPFERLREPDRGQRIEQDLVSGITWLIDSYDMGATRLQNNGMAFEISFSNTFSIVEDDPLSAKIEFESTFALRRGDWQTEMKNISVLTADATHFYLTNTIDAYEGDTQAFTKTWTAKIPRDLV